tara:strand:- start:211 stop:381 length:171 start_codon:yes stop_codon:yes gene_type:complete
MHLQRLNDDSVLHDENEIGFGEPKKFLDCKDIERKAQSSFEFSPNGVIDLVKKIKK